MNIPSLQSGDQVAIVATSGRIIPTDLTDNLNWLESLGLQSVLGKHLFEDYFEGYHYAGKVDQRLADFQEALDNPEIKAIWCARGGYGAVHLLDKVDWTKFKENPKWIIGYSDITAIHNHINNWNIPSLHAITVKRLNVPYTEDSFETLKKVLFGKQLIYQIPTHSLNQLGKAEGKLVGGNLSLIYSLIGTNSELKGENLIVFLEDWNENWYHLDRMLMNLKRNGLFNRMKGLILGSFTRMDIEDENPNFLENYDPTSYELIHNFMKEYNFPICFQFPAGHIGDNRTLKLGSQIKLEITEKQTTIEFR